LEDKGRIKAESDHGIFELALHRRIGHVGRGRSASGGYEDVLYEMATMIMISNEILATHSSYSRKGMPKRKEGRTVSTPCSFAAFARFRFISRSTFSCSFSDPAAAFVVPRQLTNVFFPSPSTAAPPPFGTGQGEGQDEGFVRSRTAL
jgi:hypothetical protein